MHAKIDKRNFETKGKEFCVSSHVRLGQVVHTACHTSILPIVMFVLNNTETLFG